MRRSAHEKEVHHLPVVGRDRRRRSRESAAVSLHRELQRAMRRRRTVNVGVDLRRAEHRAPIADVLGAPPLRAAEHARARESARRSRVDDVRASAPRRVERLARRDETLARRRANEREESGDQQRRASTTRIAPSPREQRKSARRERIDRDDRRAGSRAAVDRDVDAVRAVRHQPQLAGVDAAVRPARATARRRVGAPRDSRAPEHRANRDALRRPSRSARTITSASPGTTSADARSTRTGTGPALPSNSTFGLPMCADATTDARDAANDARPASRFIGEPCVIHRAAHADRARSSTVAITDRDREMHARSAKRPARRSKRRVSAS